MGREAQAFIALAGRPGLGHAYILGGRDRAEAFRWAMEFARKVTPYPEDILVVEAEGASVKDKAIEELQDRLAMKPMAGERTVALVRDADTMTARAQNRFLKTLEEPKGASVVVLLSDNPAALLPTLVSRCVLFRLDDAEGMKADVDEEVAAACRTAAAEILESLRAGGGYTRGARSLAAIEGDRETARCFLSAMAAEVRREALASAGLSEADGRLQQQPGLRPILAPDRAAAVLAAVEEAARDLDRFIKPSYALKGMLLKIT